MMLRSTVAALVAGVSGATFAAPAANVTTQLPRGVVPRHYDVTLVPNAAALAYSGNVRIALDVETPTREIVLTVLDIAIARAALTGDGTRTPSVSVDNAAQVARFTFDAPLAKGRYTLDIDYSGRIERQAAGLFALDYDADGK